MAPRDHDLAYSCGMEFKSFNSRAHFVLKPQAKLQMTQLGWKGKAELQRGHNMCTTKTWVSYQAQLQTMHHSRKALAVVIAGRLAGA
jgi:hypothetical protein